MYIYIYILYGVKYKNLCYIYMYIQIGAIYIYISEEDLEV